MTPHGVKASSFYGIAPMHTHPYASKVCTRMILDTFYAAQDFGTATPRTYPIINVRLLPSCEGVAAGGAFNLPVTHNMAYKENLCTSFPASACTYTHLRIHPRPINGRGFLLTYCKELG